MSNAALLRRAAVPARSEIVIRGAGAPDVAEAGRIVFEGFAAIAGRHAFPTDFPSVEAARGLIGYMLSRPDIHAVIAERDGRLVGSNFLWESDAIAGVGPITVDPAAQDAAVGRALMEAVLARATERRFVGVRLVQAAYHNRSLALYTKLGFDAREPLSTIQGPVPRVRIPGRTVRPATAADLDACEALAARLLGFGRRRELEAAIGQGAAMAVEHAGRITGYTTGVGFFGHSVAEADEDLQALIAAAGSYAGPGFLLPTRNAAMMRWCLGHGLSIVQPMTLMSLGAYREPTGAWLPSILY
jgi:GNAT superfamily N-acetyltransferase